MKKYLILTAATSIIGVYTKKNEFYTYEDALEFAETLNFQVTIYEAIAQTKIKHEIEKLDENTDNSTSKQDKVS